MTPEQIQAEKLRRQKLQEEADFEVAKEMLGNLIHNPSCTHVSADYEIRLFY